MENLKGIIFDLDGVIVTTDNCHYLAWKEMADGEGIPFDRTINERLRGVSRMQSLEIILERSPREYTEEQKIALAEKKNNIYKKHIAALTPKDILPGVREVLSLCREKGIRTAIGSSSKNTKPILEYIGLKDAFDAVVDGNDIRNSKPDPEVFLLAAQRLGLAPAECLVVEDAEAGVEAGLAGGMRVLGVGSAADCALATFRARSLSDPSVPALLAE